jgi:hypothetical protein
LIVLLFVSTHLLSVIDFITIEALRVDRRAFFLRVIDTIASDAFFVVIQVVFIVFIRVVLAVLILFIFSFVVSLIISLDLSFFFDEIYHALSTLTIFFVREILKQTSEK